MRSCSLLTVGADWLARMRRCASIQVMDCSSGYWLMSASARLAKFGLAQVVVADVARNAHQLLLALQQAQAHALLGIFHVAVQRFLLAVYLLHAQVPEGRPRWPP